MVATPGVRMAALVMPRATGRALIRLWSKVVATWCDDEMVS